MLAEASESEDDATDCPARPPTVPTLFATQSSSMTPIEVAVILITQQARQTWAFGPLPSAGAPGPSVARPASAIHLTLGRLGHHLTNIACPAYQCAANTSTRSEYSPE